MKKQTTNCEKTFTVHVSDKGLCIQKHKELLQPNNRLTISKKKKRTKDCTHTSKEKVNKWPTAHRRAASPATVKASVQHRKAQAPAGTRSNCTPASRGRGLHTAQGLEQLTALTVTQASPSPRLSPERLLKGKEDVSTQTCVWT